MNLVVECLRLSKMAVLDLWDIFQAKSKLLPQQSSITTLQQKFNLTLSTLSSVSRNICQHSNWVLGPYLLHLPVTLICRREMINSINLPLLIHRLFFSKLHRKHFAACPHFVFTSSDLYPQQAHRRHTVASAICFFHTYPITGMQH